MNEKSCLRCGKALNPTKWDRPCRFTKKKFCSHVCTLLYNRFTPAKHTPTGYCQYAGCGKKLVPRQNRPQSSEYPSRVAKRIYCDAECMGDARAGADALFARKWLRGEIEYKKQAA